MSMTDEAIHEDVSDEVAENIDEAAAAQQTGDYRSDAIEALAGQREAEILAESGSNADDEEEEEPIANDEHNQEAEEPEDPLVKVKVDGEEIELPMSEVVKGYQKDSTASKRLDQAAHERRELDLARAELDELVEQNNKQEEQHPSNDDANNLAEKIRSLHDDIAVGNDEEVIAANKELQELQGGRGAAATQEDIDLKILQATQQEVQKSLSAQQYETAKHEFINNNQDIVSATSGDQFRVQVFNEMLREELISSESNEQAFHKAGAEFRKWNNIATSQSKQQLKERLQKEPNSNGRMAVPSPKEKELTPSEIIAAMKTDRGQ